MFKNVYPLFERGRILKKELTLALRDYSFGVTRLLHTSLTDGVITGCEITVDAKRIRVHPGVIKHSKFVYVLMDIQNIPYEPTEQFSSLKIRFSTSAAVTTDYAEYMGNVVLDDQMELRENEMELCRFKLKRGSRLRNDYQDFEDIQTEFDTINLAHSTCAGIERPGFSSFILAYFAKEALKYSLDNPWDISFCQQCLSMDPVHRSVMEAYIIARLKMDYQEFRNIELFEYLNMILRNIQTGMEVLPKKGGRRRPQIEVG